MQPKNITVPVSELRELLDYDPIAGRFYWRKRRGRIPPDGRAGCAGPFGYRVLGVHGRLYREHRLAWYYVYGEQPVGDIDHINGVRHDNRIENLRLATDAQNNQNKAKSAHSSSRFMGVSWWAKAGRWAAGIKVNGKSHHLGMFDTEEEAHQAYLAAKAKMHKFNPGVRPGVNREVVDAA